MLKLLKKLLGFSDSGVDGLGLEIRELIKGKEVDPQKLIEMQTAINEMEAKHRTIFVAGWRPFIGWVCGIALAYNFIIRDMLVWYMGVETAPPALQMEHLMTVLVGMLGLVIKWQSRCQQSFTRNLKLVDQGYMLKLKHLK